MRNLQEAHLRYPIALLYLTSGTGEYIMVETELEEGDRANLSMESKLRQHALGTFRNNEGANSLTVMSKP
jgi:hypothetical protein